jgi:uncharacterized protein
VHSLNKVSIVTLVLLACAMPFGIRAALSLPIGSSGVHAWLPEGREERLRYEAFSKIFGSDQVLLVSWDGATLDDERVERFLKEIVKAVDSGPHLRAVVSPKEIVEKLEEAPLKLSRQEVHKRLRGFFLGSNELVSVLIIVNEEGVIDHKTSIELVRSAADQVPGLGRNQLRLVGTVYESFAIDEAAAACLSQLVLPSSLLGIGVCFVCLRSLRATILVMLLSMVGQLIAVSLVYYTGRQFSAVMIVLPTLTFMLTLSGAVHLVNYYLEALRRGERTSGLDAIKKGWWPCTLSSLTTMLGMGSLMTSELLPVREFGIFSAVALGLATIQLLLAFPALVDLLFLGQNRRHIESATMSKDTHHTSFFSGYLTWQSRHRNGIVVVSLVLLVLSTAGLSWLRSSTKFCDMFSPDHKTHQDMLWFEENIGPIASIEVILKYPNQPDADILDQVRQVATTVDELNANAIVGGTFSAASVLPPINEKRGARAVTIRSIQRQRIQANIQALKDQELVHESDDLRVWRISARVSAVSPMSYGEMTESVSRSALAASQKTDQPPLIEVTGLSPVMHETQMVVLSDLGYSFCSAFLLITPVMMLTVRSFFGGLLIMLPNVLPVTLAFGAMGWFGWSLDIAGILTASVALGIAVDDTLHFVCWYMRELGQGYQPVEAVRRTFQACARAMIHTSVISCCSMFPFLFASFTPTQQFAKLMIMMLVAALLGDLVLLPALLLSRLGRVIRAPKQEGVVLEPSH